MGDEWADYRDHLGGRLYSNPLDWRVWVVACLLILAFFSMVWKGCQDRARVEIGSGVYDATPSSPLFPSDHLAVSDSAGLLARVRDADGSPARRVPRAVIVSRRARQGAIVADVDAGTSGPGLFPEFADSRPVTFRVLGPADSGASRPVVTYQPRPIVEGRVTIVAGVQAEIGDGTPGVFVAVSPVRVWGFRPDVGAAVGLGGEPSLSVGLSVEPVDRLRFRIGVPILGSESLPAVGVGYRFR